MKRYQAVKRGIILILVWLLLMPIVVHAENQAVVEVEADAAILMDAKTGTVLSEQNADEAKDVAGVSKAMSILLFLEAIDSGKMSMTDSVSVSEKAASMGGMQAFLDAGGQYTVEELMKAVVMISANDACLALTEHISGSEEVFVQEMNQKAKTLGLHNTTFENATGAKSAEQQKTSARDVAAVAREILKHDSMLRWSKNYMDKLVHNDGRETELVNPNRLIRFYNGANGIQTGSSNTAGYCLAGSATRGESSYICVVLGANNSNGRFEAASALLDFGFANYSNLTVARENEVVKKNAEVQGGVEGQINLVAGEDLNLLLKKGEEQNLDKQLEIQDELAAPLDSDKAVGELVVKSGQKELARIPVYPQKSVEQRSFVNSLLRIIRMWLY
ncbi:MAG: D-alanyl-D-alanine carboxypeptidase family protein [Christensenellales bacterium]|jgi:D-alanyl-D-alanine carboxypeptidase (penicillin-binding protein 5/6)